MLKRLGCPLSAECLDCRVAKILGIEIVRCDIFNKVKKQFVFLFVLLYVMSFTKIFPAIGYVIAFWILLEFLAVDFITNLKMKQASIIKRDLMVDGHFILAGMAAWLWNLAT